MVGDCSTGRPRWIVAEEAPTFGGDPDAVTVMRASADELVSSSLHVLASDAPIRDAVLARPSDEVFAAGDEAAVPYLVGPHAEERDADLVLTAAAADRWAAFIATGRPCLPGEMGRPEGGRGLLLLGDDGVRALPRDPLAVRVAYLTGRR